MDDMEVILCDKCGGCNCEVDELIAKKFISMKQYAEAHEFPPDIYRKKVKYKTMLITCQDCGYQHEYREYIPRTEIA